jgi:hypothetical protein
MSLRLRTPAPLENPLVLAETRPQKIKVFLEQLSNKSPLESASLLFEEMEILNRQKVSPDDMVRGGLEKLNNAISDRVYFKPS